MRTPNARLVRPVGVAKVSLCRDGGVDGISGHCEDGQ